MAIFLCFGWQKPTVSLCGPADTLSARLPFPPLKIGTWLPTSVRGTGHPPSPAGAARLPSATLAPANRGGNP